MQLGQDLNFREHKIGHAQLDNAACTLQPIIKRVQIYAPGVYFKLFENFRDFAQFKFAFIKITVD